MSFGIKKAGAAVFFSAILFQNVESNSTPGPCDIRVLAPPPDDVRVFRYEHQCPEYSVTREVELPHLSRSPARCPTAPRARGVDGCSGGGSRDKRRFQAACNEHDACYATYGMTKAECDANFARNMDMICDIVGGAFCRDARQGFVSGVIIAGDTPYENGQRWARQSCI